MTMAITDIKILDMGKDAGAPADYYKIPVDLNWGADGKYLYVIYSRDAAKQSPGSWITELDVLEGENASPPPGWEKDPTDLNRGAGGKYLYLIYKRGNAEPIKDVVVLDTKIPGNDKPAGYAFIDRDLNQGAGGKYLYLCYLTGTPDRLNPEWERGITSAMFTQALAHGGEQRQEVNRAQTGPHQMTIWYQSLKVVMDDHVMAGKSYETTQEVFEGTRTEDETTWQTKVGMQYSSSVEASYGGITGKSSTTVNAEFTYTKRKLTVHESSKRVINKQTIAAKDHGYRHAVVQVGDVLKSVKPYGNMETIAEVPSWHSTYEATKDDRNTTWG